MWRAQQFRVECNEIVLQWLIYSLYCNQYITGLAIRVLLILPSSSVLDCTRIFQLEKEEGGLYTKYNAKRLVAVLT